MPSEQCVAGCRFCRRPTVHISTAPDCPHVIHLIITLFTCGLWVIVWGINMAHSAWNDSGWVCSVCGRKNR